MDLRPSSHGSIGPGSEEGVEITISATIDDEGNVVVVIVSYILKQTHRQFILHHWWTMPRFDPRNPPVAHDNDVSLTLLRVAYFHAPELNTANFLNRDYSTSKISSRQLPKRHWQLIKIRWQTLTPREMITANNLILSPKRFTKNKKRPKKNQGLFFLFLAKTNFFQPKTKFLLLPQNIAHRYFLKSKFDSLILLSQLLFP